MFSEVEWPVRPIEAEFRVLMKFDLRLKVLMNMGWRRLIYCLDIWHGADL